MAAIRDGTASQTEPYFVEPPDLIIEDVRTTFTVEDAPI